MQERHGLSVRAVCFSEIGGAFNPATDETDPQNSPGLDLLWAGARPGQTLSEKVEAVLNRLPWRQTVIFELRHGLGSDEQEHTLREIADLVKLPLPKVYRTLTLAHRALYNYCNPK
ncbi:hypothetical protein HY385_02800 [Candidatus Daviesbacteria bacterium]|nr:hypothetical protein [Candidatus Daviesbacteria bacterium]